MLITLPTGDASAIITNGICVQVNIHRVGMRPILTSKVQGYIERGFNHVHALAACVSWKDGYAEEGGDEHDDGILTI